MKKGASVVIAVLITIIVVLIVFMGLLLTGVVDININNDNTNNVNDNISNNNFDNINNNDNKKNEIIVTYKDDVFEKKLERGKLKNTRNLPVIKNSNNQTAADKIVNYLTNISNKDWKQANGVENAAAGLDDNSIVGVSYLFNTLINNENLLSIGYNLEGSMGGPSWTGVWGYNFNPNTGDILNIIDVLKEEGTVELSEYVFNEIENKYKDENTLWQKDSTDGYWKDIANKNIYKIGNWFLTDKGMTITFDKYLLGPGSSGVIVVDIPKNIVNMQLKDEYKIKN